VKQNGISRVESDEVDEMSELKQLQRFNDWLKANGAEVLDSTNEWEWCRFRIDNVVSVVYKNGRGTIGSGFAKDGQKIFFAFINNNKFPKIEHKNKAPLKYKTKVLSLIVKRDGDHCFYCSNKLVENDMTVEHLIPRSAGGKNHLSNLALSCQKCNLEAGHLSVMEKIKLRESKLFNFKNEAQND
jgi:hypothetical protein